MKNLDQWDYYRGQADTYSFVCTVLQDWTRTYTCKEVVEIIDKFTREDLEGSSDFYISGRKDGLYFIQKECIPLDYALQPHDIERLYRHFSDLYANTWNELKNILLRFRQE